MSPRFDPASYPGRRPSGPVLVHAGRTWPLVLSGRRMSVAGSGGQAPVLDGDLRWSVAYGSNACPDRLVDKGLDAHGAIVLPARLRGWCTAWETRRSATGAVPLTLVPAPGAELDTWVLGILAGDTAALDASEGRGRTYQLGHVGPVAVADRYLLEDALAYGPGASSRCLWRGSAHLRHPEVPQATAGELADRGAASVLAEPLPRTVARGWPETPLVDLPLFLYGTLQPGQLRWQAIAESVSVLGPASASGTLVATVHGYPAADFRVAAGDVHGTLVAPTSAAAADTLYRRVDRIEGVPHLFRRRTVTVRHAGERRWAAAYEWNPDQGPAPGTPVPGGRWPPDGR